MIAIKIYTKQGDSGRSGTKKTGAAAKTDIVFELLGTMDELNSHLGLVKIKCVREEEKPFLQKLQSTIMNISGAFAGYSIEDESALLALTAEIESRIDNLNALYPPLNKLVVPGENEISSITDIARTVARRAERVYCAFSEKHGAKPCISAFCNRLSDYLYTLARYTDFFMKVEAEVKRSFGFSEKNPLPLEKAVYLIDFAIKKARLNGLKIAAAVVNSQGNPIAAQVTDGALAVSYEAAHKKAYTAAALKMPTHEAKELLKRGADFDGLEASDSRLLAISGGVALIRGSVLQGGLGISGGTAEQDKQIALAALELFESKLFESELFASED